MGFLLVKVSGRQLTREDSPFPTRKHPGFGGVTVRMESFFRWHHKRMEVGYGGLADEVTGSGLNGSCYRLLVGV